MTTNANDKSRELKYSFDHEKQWINAEDTSPAAGPTLQSNKFCC
jgi:hypothetical protein